MLNHALVIARKEVVDGLRDVRSVVSSLLYALMGPLVVGLVSMATKPGSSAGVLAGMMSVFTLVAAFVGGMNVAMDTIAGERERRSLLPLLSNPIDRLSIVIGKWLAVACFSTAGLAINLVAFAGVFAASGPHMTPAWPHLLARLALGIVPLALLAASIELLISTVCRAVKEAQTYLSLIVFLPMGIGMYLVFFPAAWPIGKSLPIVGQQLQLQLLMSGREVGLLQSIGLGCSTVTAAILALLGAASQLQRDEIIYGS